MNILQTSGLGVRYRHTWALRDCTLAVPKGHVVAMIGSNGAGKTTLLQCAVGLTKPTCGTVRVLDGVEAGSFEALERVAFVAQEAPLYGHISVGEMLDLAACLNCRFDHRLARHRLQRLDIPMGTKIRRLSGGQHTQVALAVALARHPDLLILDEPLARLDPLARHDVMHSLLAGTSEDGTSVVFSSHVVSELERVANYLVLVANGGIKLAGEIKALLSSHSVLCGPTEEISRISERFCVLQPEQAGRRSRLVVRDDDAVDVPGTFETSRPTLEELAIAYMRTPALTSVSASADLSGGA